MRVEVLLFAAARDAAGVDSITVDVPENARARDVVDELGRRLPQIKPLLGSCRLAFDCSYVDSEAIVSEQQEVALIPPVSGG